MLRTIGRRVFDFDRQVAVMAVLNRTPDSFYDQGATWALDRALDRADRALEAGADWLDVGGVKAGPGAEVTEAEELQRVLPLLEALRDRTDAVVSVDTFRPGVARRALAAGADAVNDPSGLRDPGLAEAAAAAGATLVLTHTGGPPRTRPHRPPATTSTRTPSTRSSCCAGSTSCSRSATRSWSPSPTRTSSARRSTCRWANGSRAASPPLSSP